MDGRRSGKTLAMVEQLPDSGAIVIVHTKAMQEYLQQMIRDVRGAEVADASRVVIVTDRQSAERQLTGRSVPIYRDHAFNAWAPLALGAFVRRYVDAVNGAFGFRVPDFY